MNHLNSGVYDDLYGDSRPATHSRRVLFVKPDIFLVVDTLMPSGDGEHTYQARWHFKEPNVVLTPRPAISIAALSPQLDDESVANPIAKSPMA